MVVHSTTRKTRVKPFRAGDREANTSTTTSSAIDDLKQPPQVISKSSATLYLDTFWKKRVASVVVAPREIDRAASVANLPENASRGVNHLLRQLPFRTGPLSYSVARLEAFDCYTRTSWRPWQLFVFLVMPLPVACLACSTNFIPLADPTLGWKANYMFFVRSGIASFVAASGLRMQRHFYLGGKRANTARDFFVCLLIMTAYVLLLLVLSAFVLFPMPAGLISPLFIAVPIGIVGLTLAVRARHRNAIATNPRSQWRHSPSGLTQSTRRRELFVKRYKQQICFNQFMVIFYPTIALGYQNVSDTLKLVYCMALFPPIRWVFFRVSRYLCAHIEDVAPETMVFTVGFFNSLFISLCLRGSPSQLSSWLIMGTDMLHMLHSFYNLVRQARKCFEPTRLMLAFGRDCSNDLIAECVRFACANKNWLLTRDQAQALARNRKPIRWEATNNLKFTRLRYGCTKSSMLGFSFLSSSRESALSTRDEEKHNVLSRDLARQAQLEVLRDILEFMSTLEQVVLVEYVEAFVPFFYDLHSLVQFDDMYKAVTNVLMYGLLETMSLLLLYALVKWRFRLSIFTLLGFVLESHMESIQGKMMFFMTFIVGFNIEHYGESLPQQRFVLMEEDEER